MVDGLTSVATSVVQQGGGLDVSSRSFELNSTKGSAGTPFSSLLSDAVGQVDALEKQAHAAVTGLMTGSGVDVHQAMIATQKADMAFELALSVRNKAVQAYQSVMGMQF
ncbi:MAG: flagellar hook-basal body complex protein FliE [Terracidiphilus sp.]